MISQALKGIMAEIAVCAARQRQQKAEDHRQANRGSGGGCTGSSAGLIQSKRIRSGISRITTGNPMKSAE